MLEKEDSFICNDVEEAIRILRAHELKNTVKYSAWFTDKNFWTTGIIPFISFLVFIGNTRTNYTRRFESQSERFLFAKSQKTPKNHFIFSQTKLAMYIFLIFNPARFWSFTGVPYMIISNKVLDCSHGADRQVASKKNYFNKKNQLKVTS